MTQEYYREQEWQKFITNPKIRSYLISGFYIPVVGKVGDDEVRENVINACDSIITGKANTKQRKIQALKYILLNTFQMLLAIEDKLPGVNNVPDSDDIELLLYGFSNAVRRHVLEYTIPQYGDYPDDQATMLTADDMVKSIRRRRTRLFKNSRENQDMLDLLKSAHECCMAYSKICASEEYYVAG